MLMQMTASSDAVKVWCAYMLHSHRLLCGLQFTSVVIWRWMISNDFQRWTGPTYFITPSKSIALDAPLESLVHVSGQKTGHCDATQNGGTQASYLGCDTHLQAQGAGWKFSLRKRGVVDVSLIRSTRDGKNCSSDKAVRTPSLPRPFAGTS